MTRTRTRAPKGPNRDRADRRNTTDVLLGRMLRGVLTPTEAALLADHVREEQRSADENRRAMAGTTQALERHRKAADAAIREAEADAERYKADALGACETIAAMHAAATGRRGVAPNRGVVEDVADVRTRAEQTEELLRVAHQCSNKAEQARAEAVQHLAAYVDIFGPNAVTDFHVMQHRAKTAGERLARIRTMADAWEHRLPAAIRTATAADAIRRAANGDDSPVMFDVTNAQADDDANQWRARAEQAEAAATASESAAEHHRRTLAAVLAMPSGTSFGELTEYAAKTLTRAGERILAAEHLARRYRLAWFAARRDRRADRATMARELPIVQAAQQALGLDALTAAQAAERLAQWGAAGVPAAQFVTTTEQPR